MNILAAGIPALLYPFGQNREQRMRVSAFSKTSDFLLLESEELEAERFAEKITLQLQLKKQRTRARLNGAIQSCELISNESLWSKTKL